MDVEVVESVTKTIGSLALVYPYLRRLAVAETLDALTTTGKEREVPTGAIIEMLIVNRLAVRPAPISQLGAWAQSQAIEAVYGVPAQALNDDRIGRALDEIQPHLVDAWAALVLKGTQAYGLRLTQLHSDVTRVAFEGAYERYPGDIAVQLGQAQPVSLRPLQHQRCPGIDQMGLDLVQGPPDAVVIERLRGHAVDGLDRLALGPRPQLANRRRPHGESIHDQHLDDRPGRHLPLLPRGGQG